METSRISSSELDLWELFGRLWHRRAIIIVCTTVGVLLAALYLRSATYTYSASLQVAPVQGSTQSPTTINGLGGLASLAGVNLGSALNTPQFQLYLQGLTSREVSDELASDQRIMRTIFAGEWDPANARWREPQSTLITVKYFVRAMLGFPRPHWEAPDGARLQAVLQSRIGITQDLKKPVVTVTFSDPDPQFAVYVLSTLDRTNDKRLRTRALARANQYVDYLNAQLSSVTVAEHRVAIGEALSEQEKFRMMASSEIPFAAEPFDGPSASIYPTAPSPYVVLAAGVAAGIVLGIALAFFIGGLPSGMLSVPRPRRNQEPSQ